MKEATGELSTTVITVVAIAAILSLFTVFLYPSLKMQLERELIVLKLLIAHRMVTKNLPLLFRWYDRKWTNNWMSTTR